MAYLLPEMAKIHLDIRDPSMTFLHRAGVAGLFVQLKYLEYLKLQPPHGSNSKFKNLGRVGDQSGSRAVKHEINQRRPTLKE
ncbi:hypothetical protein Cha6605_3424 [Chamaesiphon minutus PCC 6605]|uniref:Uncharacterized protein n=1 Tax=Chamaesiphon minutus (strain ATCC 27169 / PCC 6605) TaxID=1173020 RepID=K9UIE5_CHAP6|nr:hypothetical protein Cha6605_3424 [Chamaesiphon minutus PCC 6605]